MGEELDYKFVLHKIIKVLMRYLRNNVASVEDLDMFKYLMDGIIDVNRRLCGVDRFGGSGGMD